MFNITLEVCCTSKSNSHLNYCRMKKKKTLIAVIAVMLLGSIVSLKADQPPEGELDSKCEVTNKKGEIVFQCSGQDDTCKKTEMGYTLKCTGEVTIDKTK